MGQGGGEEEAGMGGHGTTVLGTLAKAVRVNAPLLADPLAPAVPATQPSLLSEPPPTLYLYHLLFRELSSSRVSRPPLLDNRIKFITSYLLKIIGSHFSFIDLYFFLIIKINVNKKKESERIIILIL